MRATIATLLLALAPALPIISALPSEKRTYSSKDFPITHFCSGLTIALDGSSLHADNCDGLSDVTFHLDTCVGNFGGALGFVRDGGDGNFSKTCSDCSVDGDAVISCFCGQGAGKDFISSRLDLRDCQFVWYDESSQDIDCQNLSRECPNSE
ncbi:hypothetical protein Hte_007822 [Hypoxylon texense]